ILCSALRSFFSDRVESPATGKPRFAAAQRYTILNRWCFATSAHKRVDRSAGGVRRHPQLGRRADVDRVAGAPELRGVRRASEVTARPGGPPPTQEGLLHRSGPRRSSVRKEGRGAIGGV